MIGPLLINNRLESNSQVKVNGFHRKMRHTFDQISEKVSPSDIDEEKFLKK